MGDTLGKIYFTQETSSRQMTNTRSKILINMNSIPINQKT